jgi:hypothetical protein
MTKAGCGQIRTSGLMLLGKQLAEGEYFRG